MSRVEAQPAPLAAAPARPRSGSGFRPDIEGLRAVAVLAVVGYHCGLAFMPGGFIGVDVFYVISGFLITGLLVTEVRRTGTVSLRGFWARRARRLLPAATLVLLVTAIGSAILIPVLDQARVRGDIVASALYVANWRFAGQATDYFQAADAPSPALHMWSLGVEEQFYLLWPLLLLATAWIVRRARRDAAPAATVRAFAVVVAVVGVASFAWSLHQTAAAQPYAFFGTPSRAWQLAAGAALALGAGRLRRLVSAIPALAPVLGWGGLALVVVGITRIHGESAYPGWHALLPTLGAFALLAAGVAKGIPLTPGRLLSVRPVRAIGRWSYGWYLWHWPPLVLIPLALDRALSVPEALAVSAGTLGLAAATYHLLEHPIRTVPALVRRPGASLLGGVALSLVTVLGTVTAFAAMGSGSAATSTHVDTGDGSQVTLVQTPAQAAADTSPMHRLGCQLKSGATEPRLEGCTFGDPAGDVRVLLVGDSHAAQWFTPLVAIAEREGWRLDTWTKDRCGIAAVPRQNPAGRPYTQCLDWIEAVMQRVESEPPDVVLVAQTVRGVPRVLGDDGERLPAAQAREAYVSGLEASLQRLAATGAHVVVVGDTPATGGDPTECLAEGGSADDCRTRNRGGKGMDQTAAEATGTDFVDTVPWICDAVSCAAVIDDQIVWLDGTHVTDHFAASRVEQLARALREVGVPS